MGQNLPLQVGQLALPNRAPHNHSLDDESVPTPNGIRVTSYKS
jgi:hypothetical protein